MRWQSGRRSANIEDRRGRRLPRKTLGGGLGVIVIALIAMFFGADPAMIMDMLQERPVAPSPSATVGRPSAEESQAADFVAVVLADTEDTWQAIFRDSGRRYAEPTLVLFNDAVESACGYARAAVGPFYCPADRKVYLDLGFFAELHQRFQAPGDFAQAYVIAHEVGHHVQNLLGLSQKVQTLRRQSDEVQANRLSVMLELQADCLAGVWAHHADRARHILEAGDIEEALNAASRIGDDRLQMQSRGYVAPDAFTHGTSAQRVHWFKRGLTTGMPSRCDTFGAADP
jgi:predicted metalloprotease